VGILQPDSAQALQVRYEQLGQNEKPPQDRNKSVHTNGAFAGWPGKHQDPIERHELLGPDESSYAEHKVRLHDEAKDQIEVKLFHKVFPGGTQILLHEGWGLGREIRVFRGDQGAKRGPQAANQKSANLFEIKSPSCRRGRGRMGHGLRLSSVIS
jgi:hypothetical protein